VDDVKLQTRYQVGVREGSCDIPRRYVKAPLTSAMFCATSVCPIPPGCDGRCDFIRGHSRGCPLSPRCCCMHLASSEVLIAYEEWVNDRGGA